VVYTLKTPYRDGTTQVAFEPVDFMARLATLVPKPSVNLTRHQGAGLRSPLAWAHYTGQTRQRREANRQY
jgi:hypothetical protein